jgi:hypothetical protein
MRLERVGVQFILVRVLARCRGAIGSLRPRAGTAIRVALAAILVGWLLIAFAASASASSLVYINGGNIWLANPDGSGQYQVTLDGTVAEPFSSPTQANDGTIEAERGNKIYRMTQNGTLLNPPFSTSALGTPLDPVITPDGSKVSFWSVTSVDPCYPFRCIAVAVSSQVSYADHWVNPSTFNPSWEGWSSFSNSAWLGNSRELLFTDNGVLWYYDLGQKEPVQWIEWSNVWPEPESQTGYWYEGAGSADGTRLALLGANEYLHVHQIQFYSTAGDLATGNPPKTPIAGKQCTVEPPAGSVGSVNGEFPGNGSLFDSLSWSPDDSSLAYEYNGAIAVVRFTNFATCEGTVTQVLTGSDPNWGPANVNPAPRPAPAPPPGPTPAVVVKIIVPCSGLSGAASQICHAGLAYKSALAACNRKYPGASKSQKAKHAACRSKATTTYHRTLALIKCSKIKNGKMRAACVRKAKHSR